MKNVIARSFAGCFVRAALCLALPLALAGCGGSSGGQNPAYTPRFVPISLNLQWQALPAGRATTVPPTALSAEIRITDLSKNPAADTDLVRVGVINRDPVNPGAYTQTFSTTGDVARPNQQIVARIDFYSGRDTTGTIIATAIKKDKLQPNGNLGDFNVAIGTP